MGTLNELPGEASVRRTLTVIDGVLGPRAASWLAEDVELRNVDGDSCRGREAVAEYLGGLRESLGCVVEDVRLTVDVGRAVAEWPRSARTAGQQAVLPAACVFEVEDGLVTRVRLYCGAQYLVHGDAVQAAITTTRPDAP